jgi:hypothetical protein
MKSVGMDTGVSPNQTRQPTPGERLGFNRASLARRGCAQRSAWPVSSEKQYARYLAVGLQRSFMVGFRRMRHFLVKTASNRGHLLR